MAEGGGGDDRDNSSGDKSSQPAIQMIRARNNGQRLTKVGHIQLKVQEVLFYEYYRMVTSTHLVWLHTAFYMLAGLFDRVGLKANVR